MSRTPPEGPPDVSETSLPARNLAQSSSKPLRSRNWNALLLRCALLAAAAGAAVDLAPFGLRDARAATLGVVVAGAILLAEHRLRRATASRALGGTIGGLLGALAALLVTAIISRTSQPESTKSFLEYASLLGFGYVGVMLGAEQGALLDGKSLARAVGPRSAAASPHADGKLLDTSVLIDGRIADICEAHFLDGPLLVPQFVLHELQAIADSPDSLRRQRGRRGLEVLQRIQKLQAMEVRVLEDIPGQQGEVDRKLIEFALRFRAKIVTNDFNLNKVASVQGITVLNVNLLANALRPAVLPGEAMRVFILREGKEVNQGVAYLEDGTMVVVDGARRLINKTVDILVTSVHQTPAGKMIFGRLDDRHEAGGMKQAAVAGRSQRYEAGERAPRPLYPDPDAD